MWGGRVMQIVESIMISAIAFSLPLFIMGLGALTCERSGVTNLAIEGFMGFGAFIGAMVAYLIQPLMASGSQVPMYIGFLFAAIGGGVFSLLHAILCIKFKADQVVSGVVMNLLAVALTAFLTPLITKAATGEGVSMFVMTAVARWSIPGLSQIPILGALFKNIYPSTVIIILIAVMMYFFLYKKKGGMRLMASGEYPQALDSVGVNVERVRFRAVILSGVLSGIGGLAMMYSMSARFDASIYMGYGYLAIAANIFGNWKLIPTFFASLFFGTLMSMGNVLSIGSNGVPSEFLNILPYLMTLLALIVFSKRSAAPKALGEIYDKGKR